MTTSPATGPTTSTCLVLDRDFTVAPVPERLFGTFVEHMGRGVYTGIFEPDHPKADVHGLRTDVLDLVRDLGPTLARYPGGNFVSGYRWEDGVGPREQRPRRLDRAWRTLETNAFGLHEFMTWAQAAGTEPMMAVNLGSRGLEEACDLLEYANHPCGTALSDLRRAHGAPDPFDVRLWCLGNEMDGRWQIGHKTAHEYGRLASETARAMRRVDDRIELVASGSSFRAMETFGAWESQVLQECYDDVDLISAHAYYEETPDVPVDDFLASAVDMDAFLEEVIATVDAVRARGRHRKQMGISFDEWNVWYASRPSHQDRFAGGAAWEEAPRISEDDYSITDAVVVGTLLNSLLRRCDRVQVACQAQLVNVIGMLRSEPGGDAWKQTTALPFEEVRRRASGAEVLQVRSTGAQHDTRGHGSVPVVDPCATWHPERGELTLFLANRSTGAPARVEARLGGFPALHSGNSVVLAATGDQDRHTTNTAEHSAAVALRPLHGVRVIQDGGHARLHVELPPLSWAAVTFSAAKPAGLTSDPHLGRV